MEFLEVLQRSPAALMVAVGLLGLCVGSMLNVVIHRLPKMMEAGTRGRAEPDLQPLHATFGLPPMRHADQADP